MLFVLDVTLLLIVLLIFFSFVSTNKPYDQIAVANFDKLATAINKVCVEQTDQIISFDLDQPKPFSFIGGVRNEVLNIITNVGKVSMLSLGGDPNYVIYYESFPAGDAWAWEEYLEMPERKVVYYNPPLTKTSDKGVYEEGLETIKGASGKLKNYLEKVNIGSKPVPFVIGNVVLDNVDISVSESYSPMYGAGSDGVWNEERKSIKAFYKFTEFFQLSVIDKGLSKYRTCGENMLCMKTMSGIMRTPLVGCEKYNTLGDGSLGNGLKIFMDKPKSWKYYEDNPKFWGDVWRGVKFVFDPDIGKKEKQQRSVSIASPCSTEKLHIEFYNCECAKGSVNSYPIFEVTDQIANSAGKVVDFSLQRTGEFNDCMDFEIGEVSEKSTANNCILLWFENTDGFCTSNPGLPIPDSNNKDVGTLKFKDNVVILPASSGDVNNFWARTKGVISAIFSADKNVNPYWPR